MNEPVTDPPHDATKRRSHRVALSADVALRRSGQKNYRVNVYDMSPLGCQVEFVERPQLEELLWIKFEGLEALEAQVCWVKGFKAGVSFTTPVHAAVFDQLVARLTLSGA